MGAFVQGKAQPLAVALARAAHILSDSHHPLFFGMGADMAAGREAVRLAERLGGVVDHMHSPVQSRLNRAMQDSGLVWTTPLEARQRADVVLLLGETATRSPVAKLLETTRPDAAFASGARRRMIRVNAAGKGASSHAAIAAGSEDLPKTLAILSCILNGNRVPARAAKSPQYDALRAAAETLRNAQFGVIVWSPRDIDAVTIELLTRIADELNRQTRWSTIPLHCASNAAGIDQLLGWSCGYPARTGFGRGFPEYDEWRFDARRLLAAGEVDAAVWISTMESDVPATPANLPLISIVRPGAKPARPADVAIEVGEPGVDHDGELYDVATMSIRSFTAVRPSALPAAADTLASLGRLTERRS